VHREAARVAYLEGDVLDAVAALERAVAAAPGDPQLRAELQRVRAMVGSR
jgi:Flp pilus assembly protein TadD